MLNNRLNWYLTIALIVIVAAFYGVWRWGQSGLTAGSSEFSFFAQSEKNKLKNKNNSGLPENFIEAMPSTPEGLAEPFLMNFGEFTPVQEQKPAKGEVRLYRLGTGEHLLRIEHFSVVRGPGLHIYLTEKPSARTANAILNDFIDLGELRAQSGSLNYLIPAEIDLNGYRGVVVFTPYFNDIYATASLTTQP